MIWNVFAAVGILTSCFFSLKYMVLAGTSVCKRWEDAGKIEDYKLRASNWENYYRSLNKEHEKLLDEVKVKSFGAPYR